MPAGGHRAGALAWDVLEEQVVEPRWQVRPSGSLIHPRSAVGWTPGLPLRWNIALFSGSTSRRRRQTAQRRLASYGLVQLCQRGPDQRSVNGDEVCDGVLAAQQPKAASTASEAEVKTTKKLSPSVPISRPAQRLTSSRMI
jgi:hypothetical protein